MALTAAEVGSRAASDPLPQASVAHAGPAGAEVGKDAGLPDDLIRRLADNYAPILFYDIDEPNLPTSSERFLRSTELWFFSKECRPSQALASKLNGPQIPRLFRSACGTAPITVDSYGTRSAGKDPTFYLSDVPEHYRKGSADTSEWTTYLHAYRNDLGGVTLQFWRLYSYNTAYMLGFRTASGSHGGDWEAIHVVFKPGTPFTPVQIRLLGHSKLNTVAWSDALREGMHPLIRCEKGGHTSELMTAGDLANRAGCIEQQAWTGGVVRWPGRRVSPSGPLVNLGRKTSPAPGMEWLRYSGLWGTRQRSGILPYYRSGYWGPAFNETGMGKDGFIAAWCEGMARPRNPEEGLEYRQECYATSALP